MVEIPQHIKDAFRVPFGHYTAIAIALNDEEYENPNSIDDENVSENDIMSLVSKEFQFITAETEQQEIEKNKEKNNKKRKGEVSREEFLANL